MTLELDVAVAAANLYRRRTAIGRIADDYAVAVVVSLAYEAAWAVARSAQASAWSAFEVAWSTTWRAAGAAARANPSNAGAAWAKAWAETWPMAWADAWQARFTEAAAERLCWDIANLSR